MHRIYKENLLAIYLLPKYNKGSLSVTIKKNSGKVFCSSLMNLSTWCVLWWVNVQLLDIITTTPLFSSMLYSVLTTDENNDIEVGPILLCPQ